MPATIDSEMEGNSQQNSPINGGRSPSHVSTRKAEANRANAQKSTGPQTERGLEQVTMNLPNARSAARLLGLAEARTLKLEAGVAESLYRELIAPYEPAPRLLAMHFQDLARVQLELQALERIRDARLEDRAQQNSLKVRRLYLEMDRELIVPPRDVFEKGLCNIEDSPAKLRMQVDALTVLRAQLQRGDFESIGPALRQLYSNALKPPHQQGQLICIDCQQLMDPEGEPLSDEELKQLLFLVDRETEAAMDAWKLMLDQKTMTGEARVAELAPNRDDHWLNVQIDRLRRAVDRKQWVITGVLQTLKRPEGTAEQAPAETEGRPSSSPGKGFPPSPP
jgi:hypothetical protein